MDALALERLGVYDPSASNADDRLRLLCFLVERGATEDELVRAADGENLGALAVELALQGREKRVDFASVTERMGVDEATAAQVWRALGFTDPDPSLVHLTSAEADALTLVAAAGRDVLGPTAALALARVLGATSSRLAEAIVDAMRVQFEMPALTAGTS
jgi:hypothetical protein